jgi:hypothetical protein
VLWRSRALEETADGTACATSSAARDEEHALGRRVHRH